MKYRKQYPYVQAYGGRLYFRRCGYPHTRLPNPIGGPEFLLAYEAMMKEPPLPPPSSLPGGIVARRGRDPNAVQPLIGVYLLMRRGKIIYIGSSLNMPRRVTDHRSNGRPFDKAFYIATTAREREALEKVLIAAINPSQNQRGRAKHEQRLSHFDADLSH